MGEGQNAPLARIVAFGTRAVAGTAVRAPLRQPNIAGEGGLNTFSPLFWLLVFATGTGAGICGGLLMFLLRAVQQAAWPYRPSDDFLAAVKNAQPAHILGTLAAAGFLAGAFRMISKWSDGGPSELMEIVWFKVGRLRPIHTIARCLVSIVIVGMGATLGREAAPKQMGALCASLLGKWGRLPNSQVRLLVACGAGAGIAAVYNVPLGGAIFALEALLGTIALPLAPPALVAAGIATVVSWRMLPNEPTYDVPVSPPVDLDLIVWAIVAGPLIGLASVAYVRLIAWANALRPSGFLALVAPILLFCVVGGVAIGYPQLLGNGRGVVQRTFLGEYGLSLLTALAILRPLATAACLGSGAPGGLFTPTLTLGALLGGVLGHLWLVVAPGAPLGLCAIVGGCAMLAASMEAPVAAVALIIELTWSAKLIAPAVLATGGAVLAAGLFEDRSIYSGRSRLMTMRAAVEARENYLAVQSAVRFFELEQTLLRAAVGSLPVYVVDEKGSFLGETNWELTQSLMPQRLPLATAVAEDFLLEVLPIFVEDTEGERIAKFELAGRALLPVVDRKTREIVGVAHGPR